MVKPAARVLVRWAWYPHAHPCARGGWTAHRFSSRLGRWVGEWLFVLLSDFLAFGFSCLLAFLLAYLLWFCGGGGGGGAGACSFLILWRGV